MKIENKDLISSFHISINKISDDERYKMHYKVRRIFVEKFTPLKFKSMFNKTYPKKYYPEIYYNPEIKNLNKIYSPFILKLIRKCNFNSDKKPKDVLSKSEYQLYKEHTKNVSKLRGYIWIDQYKVKKIYNKLTEDQKIIFNRLIKYMNGKFLTSIEEILEGVHDKYLDREVRSENLISFLSSLKISKKEFVYLFNASKKLVEGRRCHDSNFKRQNYSDLISEIKHVDNKYSKLLEEDPKKAFKKLYNYHFISYGSNYNPLTGISLKPLYTGWETERVIWADNIKKTGKIKGLTKEWQHYQSKFLVRLSKNMYKKILKYAKKYPKDKYAKFFISGITQSKYGYRVNYPSKYLEFGGYVTPANTYFKNSRPRKL